MVLRSVAGTVALTALVGCAELSDRLPLPQLGGSEDETAQGIRTLALLDSSVRVRGPEGYCVDQAASNARRGFAVLAGCAVLSEDVAVIPTLDGLITVQFGEKGSASVSGNEEAFADFLESEVGRGLLAANGDAANIDEVTTETDRAGVMARFQDLTGPSFNGTSGPQWRGFLDVQDRLVTLSVRSFESRTLGRAEGERLLIVAMAAIAEVNTDATPNE